MKLQARLIVLLLAVFALGMTETIDIRFVDAAATDADDAPAWEGKRAAERFAPLDWLVGEWQGYGKFPNRTTYIHG
jgi:hypothetical protein